MLPVLVLLMAVILIYYISIKWLRWGIVAVLCLTNVFSKISWPLDEHHALQTPVLTCLQDLTSRYDNATEDIVAFFKKTPRPTKPFCRQTLNSRSFFTPE
jgi:type II secretory pathway component PulM